MRLTLEALERVNLDVARMSEDHWSGVVMMHTEKALHALTMQLEAMVEEWMMSGAFPRDLALCKTQPVCETYPAGDGSQRQYIRISQRVWFA